MKSPVLEVKQLTVRRRGEVLLEDISFLLHHMEILSVIGPQGAGKSFLFRSLLGIQKGDVSGRVVGFPEKRLGLVSKAYPCVESFTAFQNLSLISRMNGVHFQAHLAEEVEEVLKLVGLWPEIKNRLHVKVSELTRFQKIRLNLARTLLLKPNVLLLDNPTLDLDPEQKAIYENTIDAVKASAAILWINHDLEQVGRVSNQVMYLREGRLIELGSTEDVFTRPASVETERFISRRVHA